MQPANYTTYKAEQLLSDAYFLESERNPTPESEAFWREAQTGSPALAEEITVARALLRHMRRPAPLLGADEVARLWQRIDKANKRSERAVRLRYIAVAAAATVALLLVMGNKRIFRSHPQPDITAFAAKTDSPDASSSEVRLIISPQKVVAVKDKSARIRYDSDGQVQIDSRMAVADSSLRPDEAFYNQLIVPVGRTSFIVFSDGTKAWVNSGSRLVYPSVFAGSKREIYVEGEVFLEVIPDKRTPFMVKTNRMQVQVLGTSFNVNAYKNEALQQVVLVKGRVEVKAGQKEARKLSPSEMLSFVGREVSVKTVDVNEYVTWKDGFYQYRHEKLSEVFKRLGRYYGKEIVYDEEVGRMTCSGKLDLRSSLPEVIANIQRAAPVLAKETDNGLYFYVKPLKSQPDGNLKK